MHQWIAQPEAAAELLNRHPATRLVGLDTEFMRIDTFYPRLALVQVNLEGEIALLDPLALGGVGALAPRLADPATLCVMHSASEDLEALAEAVPAGLGQLFDTQIAAALCGYGAGLSYQKLVAAIAGVDLPKAETRSDWLRRPLSAEQLDYAAQDVIHLAAIHAELDTRLRARGRSDWHAQDCQRLLAKARSRDGDPQPQRGFKSAAEWSRPQQALLRRVLLWREATARQIDKPRPWLIDDAHIAEFVLRPPHDTDELFQRAKGLRALRGPQREELFLQLSTPLLAEEMEFAPIFPLPSPAHKRTIAAMKEAVVAIATELDIPDGLLCARRHLEAYVFDGQWPEALEGWRREVLQPRLSALL